MDKIPIIPGRGLIAASAIKMRREYLQSIGHPISQLSQHNLEPDTIQNNIESFIGSVEVPIGLVGPLLFKSNDQEELVHCSVGTLEGALTASMNRGAKAISQSGGFQAVVSHQKMVRAPMFIFSHLMAAIQFEIWVKQNFHKIKEEAEKYSNHAKLVSINPVMTGKTVHLKFVYQTGDASGQNMTTTCTWHAILWIAEHFEKTTNTPIEHFVIEGNGASDKKVSSYSMLHGRGINVVAECSIPESVLNRVLRTTSDDILKCFFPSIAISRLDGMIGYNINVANAIAAIFVATGQDLGSVHESSLGVLNVEKTEDGLYLSLNLPSLVIGTVGGGTHLPKQQEVLKLMGCVGNGKVERFAKLIAGFALALEISTYAAIVSGEFAKAHEKLGRNKPVNHLLKAEFNTALIQKCLTDKQKGQQLLAAEFPTGELVENGIITAITQKVSKKLIGFIPVDMYFASERGNFIKKTIIKSKALDLEVIKGLHAMAASIDPVLSDLFNAHWKNLEYASCHKKEILVYEELSKTEIDCTPNFYGKWIDEKREIYLFIQELLELNELEHINTQKHPERWTTDQIKSVLHAISQVHTHFLQGHIPSEITRFEPWKSAPLYQKLVSILKQEEDDPDFSARVSRMMQFVGELESDREQLGLTETVIHNDFNSRNVAIRKNGQPCIYDWELAVVNVPHRDVVEFLSFVMPEQFEKKVFFEYLAFHRQECTFEQSDINWQQWAKGYIYAIKEYLVTRVSFYEVAGILAKYAFSDRIFNNSFRMLEMLLEEDDEQYAPNNTDQ